MIIIIINTITIIIINIIKILLIIIITIIITIIIIIIIMTANIFSLIAFRLYGSSRGQKSPYSVSTRGYGECGGSAGGKCRGAADGLKSLHRHNGS